MMPYCIYLRKSRADLELESHGEGETLARHKKALIDLAKAKKIAITEIYEEIVSGETISSRPIMQRLLTQVEQGVWEGVLVMEVERLARGDTIDQGIVSQAFKFSNTKIITPLKTYDPNNEFDEEYFEFGLFMSRREYKTINRRLQRGRVASVMEGKYTGNKTPYGYTRIKLKSEKGYSLEIEPTQAEAVRLIYNWYVNDNVGMANIAHKLDDLSYKPMFSRFWSHATVRSILANPVYVGDIRWNARAEIKTIENGEIVKKRPRNKDCIVVAGIHQAIIQRDLFEKAQQKIKSHSFSKQPNEYELKNPLAGIVVCGSCDRNLVRRCYTNSSRIEYICPNTHCSTMSSSLSAVESLLIAALQNFLNDMKLSVNKKSKSSFDNNNNVIQKSIERIEKDILGQNEQLTKAYELVEKGIYTAQIFIERSKAINDKINELVGKKRKLLPKIDNREKTEEAYKKLIPTIENVLEIYNLTESPKEKNELLKTVIDKAIYNKTTGGRWEKSNMELLIYPKMP